MTTRPFLDTTPEDAHLAKWMGDVTKFVEDLVGDERIPASPADIKVESQDNSVKVSWRAVDEIGVSEYQIFRGDKKNFSSANVELVATVTQAVEPTGTTITYNDPEAFKDKFYFVRAVKGLQRPKIVGSVVGFGVTVSSGSIGTGLGGGFGGSISGFTGTPGSILFVNDSQLIDEDNENLFYNVDLNSIVIGSSGLRWGDQSAPDIVLTRDAANVLALRRGTNAQSFRVYDTFSDGGSSDVTATVLTSGFNEANLSSYTSASISPAANKVILIGVIGNNFPETGVPPVVTGTNITWVQVDTVLAGITPGFDQISLTVFRGIDPSPTTGIITFNFGEGQVRASWVVIELDIVDTGGADGANAIVQSVNATVQSATIVTATLASFSNTLNATLFIGLAKDPVAQGPYEVGPGFAELVHVEELEGVIAGFRVDNDTSANFTGTNNGYMSIIGIELKNVSSDPSDRYIEIAGLGVSGEAEVMNVGGTNRDLIVGTRGDSDLRLFRNNLEQVRISDVATDLGLNSLAFGSAFGVEDTILLRDGAADTLAQRRGTNPQMLNTYNTFASATDNELGEIGFIPVSNVFVVGTKKGSGGGTARAMQLRTDELAAIDIDISQKVVHRADVAQSNVTEGGIAQVVYKTAHEVHTLANANTSDTTTISIPAGAKLLAVQFNVNTAVVDDGGNDTWSAVFVTGASESLASGAAATQNTKVNTLTANDEVTTAITEIRFTANGGNFTAGVIEIVVYYMELTPMADV